MHLEETIRRTRDVVSRLENESKTWKAAMFCILEDRSDWEFDTNESIDELLTACFEYRTTMQALRDQEAKLERLTKEQE